MELKKVSIHIPTLILCIVILVALPIILYSYVKYRDELTRTEVYISVQNEILDQFNKRMQNLNFEILTDIEFISNYSSFNSYLRDNDKSKLEDDLLHFMGLHFVYDQIRFLDKNGMERVRINNNNNNPIVVPEDQLQDKSKRYYFYEVFNYSKDTTVISYLDLNVENGKVEEPIKPILRYTKPIYVDDQFSGVIVINYLAQNLINVISSELHDHRSIFYLINSNGYLLEGPDKSKLWNFMYEDKKNQTIFTNNTIPTNFNENVQLLNNKLYVSKNVKLESSFKSRIKQLDDYWTLLSESEGTYYNKSNFIIFFNSIWLLNFIYLIVSITVSIIISFLVNKVLVLNRERELLTKVIQEVVTALEVTSLLDDDDTGNHIKRVSEYSYLLAKNYGLSEKESRNIKLYASLHDIGKVGVDDRVLKKQGPLNPKERAEMDLHVIYGRDVINKTSLSTTAKNIVYYHHQNWDGTGYTEHLSEEDIPIEARIVTLADVYDALRNKRCYKEPFSHEVAKQIIIDDSGKKFDPKLVSVFLNIEGKIEDISEALK